MNIIDAIQDEKLFRPLFGDLSSWSAWMVFLKALFGYKMKSKEFDLYQKCTAREKAPKNPFKETVAMWVGVGGKAE